MIEIREASEGDRQAIIEILEVAELPADDMRDRELENFFVAVDAGVVIACAGLEIYRSNALFRSLAVAISHQRRGIAGRLCRRLDQRALEVDVKRLFLLTTTADGYFRDRGWHDTARAEVPRTIAETMEFRALCPDDAVCLVRNPGD